MRILLDTHAFLWFVTDDRRLPRGWLPIIGERSNSVYLSIGSLWEIAIKSGLGKLKLNMTFHTLVTAHIESRGFTILPITSEHLIELERLPNHHRDPFDRLIIAQGIAENLSIFTTDGQFDHYNILRPQASA